MEIMEDQIRKIHEEAKRAMETGEEYRLYRGKAGADISTVKGFPRRLKYLASDETVDRYGDIIRVKGWDTSAFEKNPVFLWGHNYDLPPIGTIPKVWKDGKLPALMTLVDYAERDLNEFADTIFRMVLAKMIRMVSVGFNPIKAVDPDEKERSSLKMGKYGVLYEKQELLELSQVTVPANPNAGVAGLGLEEDVVRQIEGALARAERTLFGKDQAQIFVRDAGDAWASALMPVFRSASLLPDAAVVLEIRNGANTAPPQQTGNTFVVTDSAGSMDFPTLEIATTPLATEDKAVERPGWDETEEMYRLRVRNPDLFTEGTMKTVVLQKKKPQVKSVMGKLKADGEEGAMTIQNLMFPKEDGWTMDDAKTWVKDHPEAKKTFIEPSGEDGLDIVPNSITLLSISGDALKEGETLTLVVSKTQDGSYDAKVDSKKTGETLETLREMIQEEVRKAVGEAGEAGRLAQASMGAPKVEPPPIMDAATREILDGINSRLDRAKNTLKK